MADPKTIATTTNQQIRRATKRTAPVFGVHLRNGWDDGNHA